MNVLNIRKKLTEKQKERLRILEPKLDQAVSTRDYATAKVLVKDIQDLLRPTGHFVRLAQSKNKLYELAIDLGEFGFAIMGLNSNLSVLNSNTRIHLETTALLAICYLRMQEVEKAKPYIKEVLVNQEVIKSERTRKVFHSEIINRFSEEASLCTLKSQKNVDFNEVEIEEIVIKLVQESTNDEIFSELGGSTPSSTKDMIFIVYDYSMKQLPSSERLALPSPEQKIKDEEVGHTVFNSVKRILYNSLCNSESEIYQAWFNNGLQYVLNKKYIYSAVTACLIHLGIGIKMIAASIIALIMKFGIEVYCDKYKPISLMEIREK